MKDEEMDDTDQTDDFDSETQPIDVDTLIGQIGVQLGSFDPWATGRALRMSDRSIKLGLCLLSGMTATAGARMVGFPGAGNGLRSAASKAARSKAMQAFLQAAKDHKAGVSDAPLTPEEKRRILAKGARGSNPQTQIRAVLADHQIEREMSAEKPEDLDPEKLLAELASESPTAAAEVAGKYGFSVERLPPEVRAHAKQHLEQLARNWIQDHPAEAKAYAEYFLSPTQPARHTNGNGATV